MERQLTYLGSKVRLASYSVKEMNVIDVDALLAEAKLRAQRYRSDGMLGVADFVDGLAAALRQERERADARPSAALERLYVGLEAENARLRGLVEQARTALEVYAAGSGHFWRGEAHRTGDADDGYEDDVSEIALAAMSATGPTTTTEEAKDV